MSRWIAGVIARIRALARAGRLRLTWKAMTEMAELGGGFDAEDVRDVLVGLVAADLEHRRLSETTREWMYVFKPEVAGVILYVKVILRNECIVVSFHEDEARDDEASE
jgi:hypothetical protein